MFAVKNRSRSTIRKAMLGASGLAICAAFLAAPSAAEAAGLLSPADGSRPALDLRDHMVNVVVQDGYAITTIEQVFSNPHGQDYEAHYSFPVPDKAAVSEFTYWIDGKPVTGEVLAKDKAREVYESEKAQGHEAGLTEQDDYRTFDINVTPVRAGQDVRVRLSYIQPAHIDTGIGRYVYPLEEGGVDDNKLAFWTANETVTGTFSFDLTLRSSYPVEAVRLPAHPGAQISRTADGGWTVHVGNNAAAIAPASGNGAAVNDDGVQQMAPIAPVAAYTLDTDIALYWRLTEGLPGSVDLVAHREEAGGAGTFMMVVTPGEDLAPITEGKDWVFVLDKSGSMQGKWHTLLDGVERALGKMRQQDRFRIVVFDTSARELTTDFVTVDERSVENAINQLRNVNPDNGTNLYDGLQLGMKRLDADRTSAIVLVTDGVANVGELRQRKFLDMVETKDVRLFTMILGNSANQPLLTALTDASNGFARNVSNSDDVVGVVLEATDKVTHAAFHDVDIKIDGVKVTDMRPSQIGSLYRGEQLVLFGHYRKPGMANVELTARISGEERRYKTQFEFPAVAGNNPEIERLWAFATIEEQMREIANFGEDADRKQAVTDVAVEYGLVTPYTSMVVVREDVFKQLGIDRKNRNRLEVEHKAAETRAQAPVESRRQDQSQPMFQGKRPSHSGGSGGGALGPIDGLIIFLLGLVGINHWRRRSEDSLNGEAL